VAVLTAWDLVAIATIVLGILVTLRRGVPKAYGFGVLMMVVFAIDVASQIWGRGPSVSRDLGFVAGDVLNGQRLWSPLTSIFVHAGWAHIIGNLFILVTAGPALEDRVGERKFLVIFFLAGFAALVAHVLLALLTPIVSLNSLALGASGAIFGVLTAFAVRYPREKLPLVFYVIIMVPSFAVLLLYLGLNLFYMFTDTTIAWWGHFAGFLVGLGFAYSLPSAGGVTTRPTARGLPDAEKLAPYALSPDTRRILERIRQFTPETRTSDDAQYVDAWLDKFFAKATCAQGHAFARRGLTARCSGGETTIEFARR